MNQSFGLLIPFFISGLAIAQTPNLDANEARQSDELKIAVQKLLDIQARMAGGKDLVEKQVTEAEEHIKQAKILDKEWTDFLSKSGFQVPVHHPSLNRPFVKLQFEPDESPSDQSGIGSHSNNSDILIPSIYGSNPTPEQLQDLKQRYLDYGAALEAYSDGSERIFEQLVQKVDVEIAKEKDDGTVELDVAFLLLLRTVLTSDDEDDDDSSPESRERNQEIMERLQIVEPPEAPDYDTYFGFPTSAPFELTPASGGPTPEAPDQSAFISRYARILSGIYECQRKATRCKEDTESRIMEFISSNDPETHLKFLDKIKVLRDQADERTRKNYDAVIALYRDLIQNYGIEIHKAQAMLEKISAESPRTKRKQNGKDTLNEIPFNIAQFQIEMPVLFQVYSDELAKNPDSPQSLEKFLNSKAKWLKEQAHALKESKLKIPQIRWTSNDKERGVFALDISTFQNLNSTQPEFALQGLRSLSGTTIYRSPSKETHGEPTDSSYTGSTYNGVATELEDAARFFHPRKND